MARAAGCRANGVAWGYHAQEELLDAGAEPVAHSAGELEELIHG
jgi:phosphoglycolate phosphatase